MAAEESGSRREQSGEGPEGGVRSEMGRDVERGCWREGVRGCLFGHTLWKLSDNDDLRGSMGEVFGI